ncbi:zinc ribbon domain-containing protein [Aneurinibacillus sp. REN35]|uniref:zinc ribbon domain-containing protein n=1 Tax=Aneurinibacillus sp. REN35 TaxID=3237286 RepID=UPI003529BE30
MGRSLGAGMVGLGIICVIVAFFEFFTLDMWETPKLFWLFFVGTPLMFIGFIILGPHIQRSYLQRNSDMIRDSMKLMGEGLRSGLEESRTCPKCTAANKHVANFCSHCGASLQTDT